VEEEGNGMEELEQGCIIGGNGKEGEEKVGTQTVYGLRETSDVHEDG
jgi:hypothetical protein